MKTPIPSFSSHARELYCAALLLLLALGVCGQARGQSQQELLFFTSVDALEKDSSSNPEIEDSDVRPAVDVLYTYSGKQFRFITEYIWSSEENELERAQGGWQPSDNTMLWLGRVHSPANFWASEYHHGEFLQTSITRPGVDEWEDESGPLPSHITGLSLEHESMFADESSISYAFTAGLGPRFEGRELDPYDLLDPGSGHGAALNYRMAYKPNVLSLSQFGLSATWSDINVESESNPALSDLDSIRQTTIGMFGEWNLDNWHVLANVVYFNNDMKYLAEKQTDDFISGYVQAEYKVSKDWTAFARTENSFNEGGSQYLNLLAEVVVKRNLVGVRWDFSTFQAISLEFADAKEQGHDGSKPDFKEARIQWGAVFP
jgi:hypothetical protein